MVHEITSDELGHSHGTDGDLTVSLLSADGRMFKRRAIKAIGTGQAHEVCWLVAELNGVRVYQQGRSVIITTQEMYP